MNTIVPAIIPQSLDHLRDALEMLEGVAKTVQIDIVDGSFVQFTSWPYRGSGSVMLLRPLTQKFELEVDLMIEAPEMAVPLYVEAGVENVVVHLESVTDTERLYAHRATHDYKLGLAIGNDTPLDILERELAHADYVQLMGIRHIGSQGQPFDTVVLDRIKRLRTEHPSLTISIDGSVNRETLPLLKAAGANRFIAGSAILAAHDPIDAYHALTAL